jgi:hypothetical protein
MESAMNDRVKAVARRVLRHSEKDFYLLHQTMESELGDEYTPEDRAALESIVKRAIDSMLRDLETL